MKHTVSAQTVSNMYTYTEQYIHMQSAMKILDMESIAEVLGHDLVCPLDLLSPLHITNAV